MQNKFSYHIPPEILKNENVSKFVSILESMYGVVKGEIIRYEKSFSITTAGLVMTRKFVDDFGGDYLSTTSKKALECLYFCKKEVYAAKGTEFALTKVLNCYLADFGCEVYSINYHRGYPLIHFTTLDSGVLPNGQDFADEFGGVFTPPKYIPTLLDDSWLNYYNSIVINLTCEITDQKLIALIKLVVFLFTPFLGSEDFILLSPLEYVSIGGIDDSVPGFPEVVVGGVDDTLNTYDSVQNPN